MKELQLIGRWNSEKNDLSSQQRFDSLEEKKGIFSATLQILNFRIKRSIKMAGLRFRKAKPRFNVYIRFTTFPLFMALDENMREKMRGALYNSTEARARCSFLFYFLPHD